MSLSRKKVSFPCQILLFQIVPNFLKRHSFPLNQALLTTSFLTGFRITKKRWRVLKLLVIVKVGYRDESPFRPNFFGVNLFEPKIDIN